MAKITLTNNEERNSPKINCPVCVRNVCYTKYVTSDVKSIYELKHLDIDTEINEE
jgi:hypothetical protein